jgi:hypothetical protein
MTVQIIRGAEVNRPEPDALSSSVLDHATVVEKSDFGRRNNEGLWPSYNCLDLLIPTPICPDPMLDGFKSFDVAGWVPGFEFAVYGGVQCSAVGLDKADQKSEVERVFGRSEGKGVEQALLANRFVARVNGSDETGPEWEAPVDLGAAPGIAAALGILEGYAAANYAGVPTLHLPRTAVLMAFGLGLITKDGDKFFTKTGAKVASGGGYDDPDGASAAARDLYVTGEVYVERSEEVSIQSFVIPGDGSGIGSGENGLADNTVLSLVERMYRVGVDCLLAKVSATLWSA